jgi:hypothetical protein
MSRADRLPRIRLAEGLLARAESMGARRRGPAGPSDAQNNGPRTQLTLGVARQIRRQVRLARALIPTPRQRTRQATMSSWCMSRMPLVTALTRSRCQQLIPGYGAAGDLGRARGAAPILWRSSCSPCAQERIWRPSSAEHVLEIREHAHFARACPGCPNRSAWRWAEVKSWSFVMHLVAPD